MFGSPARAAPVAIRRSRRYARELASKRGFTGSAALVCREAYPWHSAVVPGRRYFRAAAAARGRPTRRHGVDVLLICAAARARVISRAGAFARMPTNSSAWFAPHLQYMGISGQLSGNAFDLRASDQRRRHTATRSHDHISGRKPT